MPRPRLLTYLPTLACALQICRSFNEQLGTLSESKLRHNAAISESELLCVKWARGRLHRTIADATRNSLLCKLAEAKEKRAKASADVASFKSTVERAREA
eukprot:786535-Pleurochrysis_carterae.AAC.1